MGTEKWPSEYNYLVATTPTEVVIDYIHPLVVLREVLPKFEW